MSLLTSLVASYSFNESSGNASDNSGNTNTLTNTNTITYSTGLLSNAAYLTAASSMYFTAADSASLSVTGDISFAVWVWINTTPTQGQRYIILNKEGSYSLTYERNKTGDGALSELSVICNVTGAGSSGIAQLSSTTSAGDLLSTGAWHHIAFTRVQSSGAYVIYIDGVANTSGTASAGTGITDTANALELGRGVYVFTNGAYYGINFFDGRLDETAVWAKALTSGEVTTLYNAGAGKQYPYGVFSMVATKISYALTLEPVNFLKAHNYVLAFTKMSFALTDFAVSFTPPMWTRGTKHTTAMSNSSPHSTAWVDGTKHSTAMTNQVKH